MKIEKLLLKKEESPILNGRCFLIPIHPKLLSSDIHIDEKLANKVFPRAAEEWYYDLKEYSKTLQEIEEKEWINNVFLERKPKIKKDFNRQLLDTINWEDRIFNLENGFANTLSISRDAGGTLYFHKESSSSDFKIFVSADSKRYIRFSKEKLSEFNSDKTGKIIKLSDEIEGVKIYHYNEHNIDYYPGALFLRNWALLYLNEAMKQILS